MGLDLLEFVLAVEDAFGLAIPDEVAETLTTPGLLVDYLESRLAPSPNPPCLHQRAFHRLRRAGMKVLDRPRSAFALETPWETLLHRGRHSREWNLLHRTSGLNPWPRLKPFLSIGPTRQTVGDTMSWLASNAAAALLAPDQGWSRQLIEETVARLIAQELGIREFRWTDRFVRDLRVD
jgi:Acyl carrier protein